MRIPFLPTLLVLAAPLVLAQDPSSGTHSDHFDAQKYSLLDRLLITPRTHPDLFSFTGRWLYAPTSHPLYPAYHATLWPANSVTVLFHGDKASIKLLPAPQGKLEHFSFVVSIDGGDDIRYDTPAIDTDIQQKEGHFIPLQFDIHAGSEQLDKEKPQNGKRAGNPKLTPHTVRITSVATTPFSFEGLLVENTKVSQGHEWFTEQSRRPVMEFIGEGLDAERPGGFFRTDPYEPAPGESVESPTDSLFSTIQWRIAERLRVRHTHMSAGVCLIDKCGDAHLPGLSTQYFYTSPLNASNHTEPRIIENKFNPHHLENIQTPFRFPETSNSPPVHVTPATHVIVDTGVYDLLMHNQSPESYEKTLALFLTKMRNQAHPESKILVIARKGLPATEMSILPNNPQAQTAREELYSITESVVKNLGDTNMYLTPVSISSIEDPATSYLRAICPHLLPPPSILAKTKAMFMEQLGEATSAQKVCLQVHEMAYRRQGVQTFWGLVVLGAIVTALYIARSTVVGALAALMGRKRLGLEEDEEAISRERAYQKIG